MSNTWVTGDTHGYHKNICEGSSEWSSDAKEGEISGRKQNTRPFKDQFHMTDVMVQNINKVVMPDDTLYHVGDWTFGGIDKIWEFRKRINCNNIHLIYGNHDEHIENNKEVRIPKTEEGRLLEIFSNDIDNEIQIYDKDYLLVPCQKFFKSTQHYLELKGSKNGRRIVMCHYAFRVWNKSHHGSINLYGHSHGTLDKVPYGMSMDVGIDTHPEFRPYHIDEIYKIMAKRQTLFVDHHSKDTN